MSGAEHSVELAAAIEAAQSTESIIMDYYSRDLDVSTKADGSPTTLADIEAEDRIIRILRDHFPEHGFIGEESGDLGGEHEYTWVVDPIDGTKNFVRRIPFFGTQIALIRRGVPIIGVSKMPALGELIYAQVGKGAWLDDRPARVSDVSRMAEAHLSVGGMNHFVAAGHGERLLRVAASAGRVRSFGDSYAYHLVATGRCEAVLETGLRFWDVAAIDVIVREAGGTCTDLVGRPIGPETTAVLCSNGRVHAEILSVYAGTADARRKPVL